MVSLVVSLLVELLVLLALAVVLSGYERRSMALLHNRDAPIAYLLLGVGQPVADGGKLLMKSTTPLVPDTQAVGTSVGVVDLSEYQSSDTRRSNRYILSWHLLAVAVPD